MSAMETESVAPAEERPELRAEPRFTLTIMRVAKLLCETGEYVGVVRDISSTGTKVRLFHETPPDTHLFLELGNGQRYAVERMWHRDFHAGFRFSCSIGIAEFTEEFGPHPRRPMRLRMEKPVLVAAKGTEHRAMLANLSQHGACIETGSPLAVCERLRLEVDGLPPRVGHVRWRKGSTHGLVFQQAFRLDEFAKHAFALQPFVPAPEMEDVPSARVA
ncbi:MAG: PilZ domain-containing protein [Novosphingobium sp.]|nr:PilZ domain-containing protein [Novosphingobium sp.]